MKNGFVCLYNFKNFCLGSEGGLLQKCSFLPNILHGHWQSITFCGCHWRQHDTLSLFIMSSVSPFYLYIHRNKNINRDFGHIDKHHRDDLVQCPLSFPNPSRPFLKEKHWNTTLPWLKKTFSVEKLRIFLKFPRDLEETCFLNLVVFPFHSKNLCTTYVFNISSQ